MRYHKVADESVRRLPIYLRELLSLSEQNQANISSQDMAELLDVNPWQMRKDFSYFGVFGTAGVGYNIKKLIKQIKKILKLDVVHKAALVGAGNLGSAIMAYPGFGTYGFDIAAEFDTNPKKIGRKVKNITIEDVSNLSTLKKRKISLAIIAVPRDKAQRTADTLVKTGIKGKLKS